MKPIIIATGIALAFWALPAGADEPAKPESQHERFAHCAHESTCPRRPSLLPCPRRSKAEVAIPNGAMPLANRS